MNEYTEKYRLKDINCACCAERHRTKYGTCGYKLCPHIMKNLPDLFADSKFYEAVRNAETCKTNYRNTLKILNKREIEC
jgi:hypothetical protein